MKENETQYGEKGYRAPQQTEPEFRPEESIDLVEMIYMLLAHWWQIILSAVLCGALAFGYTYYRITPMYQTTAKMFLASTSASSSLLSVSDLAWGTNMRWDYQQLLLSRPLLENVIESLHLSRSSGELAGMIRISNPNDTRILCVTVTSPYPDEAADIANELINQCRTYLPEIMKMDAPSFYESAQVPTYKSSPNYVNNTILGAVGGVALCCAVLLAGYLMNDRLVTPDDVTKFLGIQPLAAIPEANEDVRPSRKKKDDNAEQNAAAAKLVEKRLARRVQALNAAAAAEDEDAGGEA